MTDPIRSDVDVVEAAISNDPAAVLVEVDGAIVVARIDANTSKVSIKKALLEVNAQLERAINYRSGLVSDVAEHEKQPVTDGGVDVPDNCPKCGGGPFYRNTATAFWCENCEREVWLDGDTWYSCDETGEPELVTDGGRSRCANCGAWLPDEIDEGTGVYCSDCGHGQHVTDGGRPDDDLEAEYELRLQARKADLVELLNVIHAGLWAKTDAGDMVPPDHRMIHRLVEDLKTELDLDDANAAMLARLETGDVLVGESIDAELVDVEEAQP